MLARTTEVLLEDEIRNRRDAGIAFAVATIVRTVASTSAKPGAKALIEADGAIAHGFLGGGCVRSAVGRAARDAIANGQPQFLSLRPEDLLDAEGVAAGDERDGILYARNGCPSEGSLDIFVEPVLPLPHLLICGSGAVAAALIDLSRRFDLRLSHCTRAALPPDFPHVDTQITHFDEDPIWQSVDFCVVATQGQGDQAALHRALISGCGEVSFLGSRRKFTKLAAKLRAQGIPDNDIARVKAPAGLDIHAITPEEIALSILAQIVMTRRARDRREKGAAAS